MGAGGSRRPLDLGAGVGSSHLMLVTGTHLCQESGEMKELCALARRVRNERHRGKIHWERCLHKTPRSLSGIF